MPNWCSNILDIEGPEDTIQEFLNRVTVTNKDGNKEFDFNKTVPQPKELEDKDSRTLFDKEPLTPEEKELMDKYGATGWYNWRVKFWGTKWSAGEFYMDGSADQTRLSFDTAWSPPCQWLETTARLFPSLKFTLWYGEGGAGFWGKCNFWTEEGVTEHEETELSEHDWNMEWDADYREEYEHITEGDYQEVLEDYTEEGAELNYSCLAPFLLERIKKDDLPLFLNFEWYGEEDTFEKLLKGE